LLFKSSGFYKVDKKKPVFVFLIGNIIRISSRH